MRRSTRFLAGVLLGGGSLAGYLALVGVEDVLGRLGGVATWALAAVAVLVVTEGVVDGVGVWASVRPLDGGLSPARSVQFALAGDFFDMLSPAGPVSSEPIMARFISVATGTGYGDALGVRSVAKYVKSAAQLGLSTALGAVVLVGPAPRSLVVTLGGAVLGVLVVGAVVVRARGPVSRALGFVLGPVVRWGSSLYRDQPHDGDVVADGLDRFWERVLAFRDRPALLGLVALSGLAEQVLVAVALWVALAGTGTPTPLLPVVVVVPLPQVASVVPVPGSLGAYDVFLGGVVAVVTGLPAAAAAAAVLLVRACTIPFAVTAGGVAVAFLRGWRPGAGE